MGEDRKQINRLYFYLSCCRNWTEGAIMQGNRVLSLQALLAMLPASPEAAFAMMDAQRLAMKHRNAEDHFFVIAVDRVFSWLKTNPNCGMQLSSQFLAGASQFEGQFPKRKLTRSTPNKPPLEQAAPEAIRDMREHEIEYLGFGKGPGKYQPSYMQPVNEGTREMIADASSVIVTNDGYLIGGWLNVQIAIEALTKLLPTIEKEIRDCEKALSALGPPSGK